MTLTLMKQKSKKQQVNTLTQNQFYQKTIAVNESTGLPEDYESFFVAYRPLMLAVAKQLHIPEQDREDAVQEVQIKFWRKHGLDMYNPELGTQFGTMLRKWTALFMLQERDKVIKTNTRYVCTDPYEFFTAKSINSGRKQDGVDSLLIENEFVKNWFESAVETLERIDRLYLIPVLILCVDVSESATAPTRAQIAEAAGVPLRKATSVIKELREVLSENGLGMESLYR